MRLSSLTYIQFILVIPAVARTAKVTNTRSELLKIMLLPHVSVLINSSIGENNLSN